MRKTCSTCRFFEPFEPDEGEHVRNGWCNRYPPTYIGRPYSHYLEHDDEMDSFCWANPVVGVCATCGEWRKVKHGKDS